MEIDVSLTILFIMCYIVKITNNNNNNNKLDLGQVLTDEGGHFLHFLGTGSMAHSLVSLEDSLNTSLDQSFIRILTPFVSHDLIGGTMAHK